MRQLPPFHFDQTISPDDGWHDKVEWNFTPRILHRGQDYRSFLYHLATPDSETRASQTVAETYPTFGWLLSSPSITQGYRLKIRKSSYRRFPLPIPLFTGDMRLQKKDNIRKVCFFLKINPSRMAHHQPTQLRDTDQQQINFFCISRGCPRVSFDGEFSLDGQDNWIPQTSEYLNVWRRPKAHAFRCFLLLHNALRSEVNRACQISNISGSPISEGRHNLRKLETYWEFLHDDPTRLVSSLIPHLKSFGKKRITLRNYKKKSLDQMEIQSNSLSFNITLGLGEVLAIYAKTNRRIRFEIRQDFSKNSKCLNGSHTASSLNGLNTLIEMAREHCAEIMNSLFTYLDNRTKVNPDSASTVSFITALATALRKSEHFSAIFSLLLTNHTLRSNPALKNEIRTLCRFGILELHGVRRNGCYKVASRYADALTKLQKKALASEFLTRER